MSIGPKKEKNRCLKATISCMRRHAPFEQIDPYFCMSGGVADVINCANFFENPSKDFGAVRPWRTAFPIDFVHGPYNILDAILNFENAKGWKSVHPTDSWTTWYRLLKNAENRLLPDIARFDSYATGLNLGLSAAVWNFIILVQVNFAHKILQLWIAAVLITTVM